MCDSSNHIFITYLSRIQYDPLLTGKPAPSAPMSPNSSSASQSAKEEPWTVLSDDYRTAPWDGRSNGSSGSAAGQSSVPSSLVRTAATATNKSSHGGSSAIFGRATAAPASGSQTAARTGRQWEMTKPRDPKDEWDHVEYPKKR
jgi:hypothetical protein